MSNIRGLLKKKNIEIIVLFLVTVLFFKEELLYLCKEYSSLDFDSQALLTWDYAAFKDVLPYKEIYYPYGLLFYYRENNIVFNFFYFFMTSSLFIILLFYLKKIWNSRVLAYLSIASLFILVKFHTGFNVFSRYGIIVTIGILYSFLLSRKKLLNYKTILLLGIINGVTFSLVNDQGMYASALLLLLLPLDPILKKGHKILLITSYYVDLIWNYFLVMIGFTLGIIPFFAYLIYTHSAIAFLDHFLKLSDAILYAKTGFYSHFITFENLFVFSSLLTTIFLQSYKYLFGSRKISANTYLQICLFVILLFLEWKSTIRSISGQIIFVSLLLYFSLFYEIQIHLLKQKISKLLVFVFILLFSVVIIYGFSLKPVNNFYFLNTTERNFCIRNNIFSLLDKYPNYLAVKKNLGNSEKFNGKIFSFPGDPVFYLLFNQIPPYYFSNYEGSPIYAQNERIRYINENKIYFLLYNLKIEAIQDNVPNYLRSAHEFKYILNNFTPVDRVGNFILFKKDSKKDIFNEKFLNKVPELKKYLLQVDFASIPKSEGFHKKSLVKSDNNIIFPKSSIKDINSFLTNKSIKSDNTVLVVWAANVGHKGEKASITLKTNDNLETKISFYQCSKRDPCIINLSHIPLFYKNRIIKKIIVDQNFKDLIEIRNRYNNNELW